MNVNKIYMCVCVGYNFCIHGTHISHSDTTWYKTLVQWFSNLLIGMLNMVTKKTSFTFPSSTVNINMADSSNSLAPIYQATLCPIPDKYSC